MDDFFFDFELEVDLSRRDSRRERQQEVAEEAAARLRCNGFFFFFDFPFFPSPSSGTPLCRPRPPARRAARRAERQPVPSRRGRG